MVKSCVHKNLLFHYYLLSLCIVMCETYLVQCIGILFVFIVSNIGNMKFYPIDCYNKHFIVSRCLLKLVSSTLS